MTKQNSESPEIEVSGDVLGRLTMLLTEVDDETELSSDQFPIKEEKIEEIMQELYREITCSSLTKVDSIISPPSTLPSPSIPSLPSLPFDGKSESCGVSVSESGSTVMAGVEYVGATRNMGNTVGRGCGSGEVGDQKMEGCESCDDGSWEVCDDQWVARVLGWGPPLEFEEWT